MSDSGGENDDVEQVGEGLSVGALSGGTSARLIERLYIFGTVHKLLVSVRDLHPLRSLHANQRTGAPSTVSSPFLAGRPTTTSLAPSPSIEAAPFTLKDKTRGWPMRQGTEDNQPELIRSIDVAQASSLDSLQRPPIQGSVALVTSP